MVPRETKEPVMNCAVCKDAYSPLVDACTPGTRAGRSITSESHLAAIVAIAPSAIKITFTSRLRIAAAGECCVWAFQLVGSGSVLIAATLGLVQICRVAIARIYTV